MQFNNLPFSRANWTTNWTALARQWSIVSNWKSRKSRAKSSSSWERLSELSRIDTGKSQTSCSSVCDRETRSRNLIDNVHEKLAQTNKKLIDVKRVCTEATKHCLKVQLENVRWRLFEFFFVQAPAALATELQNLLRNIFFSLASLAFIGLTNCTTKQ